MAKRAVKRNIEYINAGSAALAPMPKHAIVSEKKELSNSSKRNREKAKHMSLGYVAFLAMSLVALCTVCALYIQIQSDITILGRSTSKLEGELMDITLSNDEEYARIMGAVDIENIKKIAMEELGMTYPDESQVVEFINNDSDFVRQFEKIPD